MGQEVVIISLESNCWDSSRDSGMVDDEWVGRGPGPEAIGECSETVVSGHKTAAHVNS